MSLVLGPVLRHVGETTASVWVQLDRAATVTVLGCQARTFEVCGHHYAVVPVTGLEPDTRYPYEVLRRRQVCLAAAGVAVPSTASSAPGARRPPASTGSSSGPAATPRSSSPNRPASSASTRSTPTPPGWRDARHTSGRTRCCCSATRSTPTSSPRRTAAASPGGATATRTGPTTRSSATTSTSVSTATPGPTPRSAGSCPASPPQ